MVRRLLMTIVWVWAAGTAGSLPGGQALSQSYTAEDFGRLVKASKLVAAGDIGPSTGEEGNGGFITILSVMKNDLPGITLRKGDSIPLNTASNNMVWSRAVIQYEKDQVGVWILNATARAGRVEPAEIVAHFITDKSTLGQPPAAKTDVPMEQWGSDSGGKQWAVIKVPNASTYTLKGKFVGVLKAGTVLDVLKISASTAGEVAVCRPDLPVDEDEKDVVLLTRDLNVYPGLWSRVDEKRRALCVREGELLGKLKQAGLDLMGKGNTGNPYTMEYQAAKATYDQYWNRVRDLQGKRDRAGGSGRINYADELRAMKGEDVRVGVAFEAARKKYEAWQTRQGKPTLSSPEILAIEKELAGVREQLRQLK